MNTYTTECNDDSCTWDPRIGSSITSNKFKSRSEPVTQIFGKFYAPNQIGGSTDIEKVSSLTLDVGNIPVLKVKKIHPDAQPLKKAYEKPACIDISIIRLIKVENGIAYFGTGWSYEIPSGFYVDLHPRSSCPKNGWTLANSVGKIDEDYTGEIILALQPTSALAAVTAFGLCYGSIKAGGKFDESTSISVPSNNIVKPAVHLPSANEVTKYLAEDIKLPLSLGQFSLHYKTEFNIEEVDELKVTQRGDGAFGSSNK